MKKIISILIVLISLLNVTFSQTGWFWLNPLPQGNRLNDVKFINSLTGYTVGEAGTILKTTNGGLNWTSCNPDRYWAFGKLSIIGSNTIYITTNSFSIWKSTDAGLTWNTFSTYYMPASIFFLDNNTGFIGCTASLIRKTTDGGESWTNCSILPVNTAGVAGIYFLNVNTGIISNGNVIQRTTNSGLNWSIVYKDPTPVTYNSIVFTNNMTGYITGSNGYILKTVNGGSSWFSLNSGTTVDLNSIAFLDQNNLFAVGLYGLNNYYSIIIRSTNSGGSWNQVYSDSLYTLFSICTASGNIYTCGSMGGFIKSTDSGNNWFKLSSGIYRNMKGCYFFNSQTGYVTFSSDSILKTTNSGLNWILINTGLNSNFSRVLFTDPNTGYLGGLNGAMAKTTNGGSNWTAINPAYGNDIYTICFVNNLTGYIAGNKLFDIKHTSNGGLNWDLQTLPIQGLISRICFVNINTGFAATGIGEVAKTTNGGINWFLNFHTGSDAISDLCFPDENTGYVLNHYFCKTTNCGINWLVLDTISGTGGWGMSFEDANTGFVGAYIQGGSSSYPAISRTTNGGISWTATYPGMQSGNSIFAVGPDVCFLTGSYGALLRYGSGLVSIKENNNNFPNDFSLSQNYPNPFNPGTKIKFDIRPPLNPLPRERDVPLGKEGTGVVLRIYDILGREVATLVNEPLKPGTYEVEWDGSNYPSGVYFYKLETGTFTETKKMVLIK